MGEPIIRNLPGAPLLGASTIRPAVDTALESFHAALPDQVDQFKQIPVDDRVARSLALKQDLQQASAAAVQLHPKTLEACRALSFQALLAGLQAGAIDASLLLSGVKDLPALPGFEGAPETMNPLPRDEERSWPTREESHSPLLMNDDQRNLELDRLSQAASVVATTGRGLAPGQLDESFRLGYRFGLVGGCELADTASKGLAGIRAHAREQYAGLRDLSPDELKAKSDELKRLFLEDAAGVVGIVAASKDGPDRLDNTRLRGLEAGLCDGAIAYRDQVALEPMDPSKLPTDLGTNAPLVKPGQFMHYGDTEWTPESRLSENVGTSTSDGYRDGFLSRSDLAWRFSNGYQIGLAVAAHWEQAAPWVPVEPGLAAQVAAAPSGFHPGPETALLETMKTAHLSMDTHRPEQFHRWLARTENPPVDPHVPGPELTPEQRAYSEGLFVYDGMGNDYRAQQQLGKAFGMEREHQYRESERQVLESAVAHGWPADRSTASTIAFTHEKLQHAASQYLRDDTTELPQITAGHLDAWLDGTREAAATSGKRPEEVMWETAREIYGPAFHGEEDYAQALERARH
ncbi:MAG: hypothetical protein HY319_18595 [Armatimonadetes bacterium]|nr:hypothetical protein [Armatimonadota bacterium]